MSETVFTSSNVAAVAIDPELLGRAMRRMADEHERGEEDADPNLICFFTLMEHLGIEPGQGRDEEDESPARHSLTVMAMVHRLTSMARLSESGRLDAWSNDDPKSGAVLLHPALINATARCTLRYQGEDHYFDADEFLQLALEDVEPNEGWSSRKS
jgi:hypothetical protein